MPAELRLTEEGVVAIVAGTCKVIAGPYTAEQIAAVPKLLGAAWRAVWYCEREAGQISADLESALEPFKEDSQ